MRDLPFDKVGVLMGGTSDEREISLRSGQAVLKALKSVAVPVVGITLSGKHDREAIESSGIDFAFLALHGTGGEDGSIQTLLEELDIPYLGSGPDASRIAFDKVMAKTVLQYFDIPVPRYQIMRPEEDFSDKLFLSFPVFLKPISGGSSIDIFQVHDQAELKKILKIHGSKHSRWLVEEAIRGRELTVGVLGTTALPVIEIRTARAFYDYAAKYTTGLTQYIVPAELDSAVAEKVRHLAVQAHQALGLRDFSRIDFILEGNTPYVLEANSIPGFTETSLLPKAANLVGLTFASLCEELIETAWKRIQSDLNRVSHDTPQKTKKAVSP